MAVGGCCPVPETSATGRWANLEPKLGSVKMDRVYVLLPVLGLKSRINGVDGGRLIRSTRRARADTSD